MVCKLQSIISWIVVYQGDGLPGQKERKEVSILREASWMWSLQQRHGIGLAGRGVPGNGRLSCLWSVFLGFFLLLVLSPCLSMAGGVEVLTPPPNALIQEREPFCHLVLRFSSGAVPQLFRAGEEGGKGKELEPIGIWRKDKQYYVHYRLPLRPGRNLFEVSPGDIEVHLAYRPMYSQLNAKLEVTGQQAFFFHRDRDTPKACRGCHGKSKGAPKSRFAHMMGGAFSPACYSCHKSMITKAVWKHGPAANWLCLGCHRKAAGDGHIVIPCGKVETYCYRCHVNEQRWKGLPHVHGPVGTGDCTVCHNPHGSSHPYQLWADGREMLCVDCHTDKKRWVVRRKRHRIQSVHGILKGDGCLACHSPHATRYRYQLRRPINKLCVSCHTHFKGIKRGHPVGGHPVEGAMDPLRQGRRFSCTSCHNPHGSRYSYMLIGDYLGGQVCARCHQ